TGFPYVSRGPCRSAPSRSTPFEPRISGLRGLLFYRRERRRHQQLADDVVDDLAVRLALRAAREPIRIGLECRPLFFAIGERVPRQEVCQFLIGSADQRREEAGLLDAVLVPQLQCEGIKSLQQRRQPARNTAIDAHFQNHWSLPCFLVLAVAGEV